VIVNISTQEMGIAMQVAYSRWKESTEKGRQDSLYKKEFWLDGFAAHLQGACGEIAVAKALNIYPYLHVNQFSGMKSDLPGDIEVRCRSNSDHDLIIRDSDPHDRKYVLVRGGPPQMNVVGWSYGREHCVDEYRKDWGGFGEAWFIPANVLREIEDINNA